MTLISASMQAHTATNDSENNPQYPLVVGTVVGVTNEGVMLVHPKEDVADEVTPIRQWGYEVEPEFLSFLTLGREVRCSVLFDTGSYIGGHCLLSFFKEPNEAQKGRDQSSISRYADTPIRWALNKQGLGNYRCSIDDKIFFAQMPKDPPYDPDHFLERCAFFEK